MKMAVRVGFTLDEAEQLRRIVGKKKVEQMPEWKEKIRQKVLDNGFPEVVADILWKVAEDSANYSFNKCLSRDTLVETPEGATVMSEIKKGDSVLSYNRKEGRKHFTSVVGVHSNKACLYEVRLDDGSIIKCSLNHKFLCSDGEMHQLKEIASLDLEIMCK